MHFSFKFFILAMKSKQADNSCFQNDQKEELHTRFAWHARETGHLH